MFFTVPRFSYFTIHIDYHAVNNVDLYFLWFLLVFDGSEGELSNFVLLLVFDNLLLSLTKEESKR